MVSASFLANRDLIVHDFIDDIKTRNGEGRMCVLVEENGNKCKFVTNNPTLKDTMRQIKDIGELPFQAGIRNRNLTGGKIDYYFELYENTS